MSHPQLSVSLTEAEAETETQDQRTNNTPSPATGQLRPESQELTDGMYMALLVYMYTYYFHKLIIMYYSHSRTRILGNITSSLPHIVTSS